MKKIAMILMFTIVFFLISSCSKSEDAAIIDCLSDSLLTELKHTADGTNSKIVNYNIHYSGSKTISSVKWTFGDGTPVQTVNTATGAISHTYSAAGTFEVKADVTLTKDGGTCIGNLKKSITVNQKTEQKG